MLPIYSVEKERFHQMLKKFDSRYEVPSLKYFSQTDIPKQYDEVRKRVAGELNNISYYAATTDLWSSATGEPYLCYTVHFIDEKWSFQSRCLQALYLLVDHSAKNIADALSTTLQNWNLDPSKQV